MPEDIFLFTQVFGIALLGYLMGNMVGYNAGHRDATKTWREIYKNVDES